MLIESPSEMGYEEYHRGLERLIESFSRIPTGKRVRLAKKTSNLFRSRQKIHHPGLDVSGLNKVISVNQEMCTAEVAGMCTYEDFVDATMPYNLAPTVVPQLKTITVGGAVTGMGIESSSFRLGLPHEAISQMDILLADGSIVTASPNNEFSDLFFGFPNSYGTLGYCIKATLALDTVQSYIKLTHLRFNSIGQLCDTLGELLSSGKYQGSAIDYLDGVVFSLDELYLTVGQKVSDPDFISDYTKNHIYYRSIQHNTGKKVDFLTTKDYFWRWDTDWFWCSRAFGAQNPRIRRLWPKKYLRSSFYWKLVALDHRYDIGNKLNARKGLPRMERVVQDIEVPITQLSDFISWFFTAVLIAPVWLCPMIVTHKYEEKNPGLYILCVLVGLMSILVFGRQYLNISMI